MNRCLWCSRTDGHTDWCAESGIETDTDNLDDGNNVSSDVRKLVDKNFQGLLWKDGDTGTQELRFSNVAPQDEEWTAHVKMLNEYTTPDRYLRHIIMYARSGEHYPTNMHVDLIEQLINSRIEAVLDRVEGEIIGKDEQYGKRLWKPARNEFRSQQRYKLSALRKEVSASKVGSA